MMLFAFGNAFSELFVWDRNYQIIFVQKNCCLPLNKRYKSQFYNNIKRIKTTMQKDQLFSIFLDTSGSVGGSKNYWGTVEQLVNLYGAKIKDWYFWNSNLEPIDKKRFLKAIQEKRGWNGTSPQVVAEKIVRDKVSNIILITDGEVGQHDVEACDKLLKDYKLNKSICYIIGSYGQLNMSVTCPFTRDCDNEVYSKKADGPIEKLVKFTPNDYKILDKLQEISLENFEAQYDLIEGLIISLNMGKDGNIPLKNQIVIMKNRLVKQLSKKMGDKDQTDIIRACLEDNNIEGALKQGQIMIQKYFHNQGGSTLEKKISHLINLCGDLRGKYNVNEIKSNRMAIAKDAQEGKIDKQVEMTDLSKNPIQCPIILDEDIPQILIDEGEPILLNLQKHVVDDIASCPLRILNYPDVKDKFKKRLSNFIGIKYGDKFMKNPFTQNKLAGAIPLGTHHSHVKVGNHTLAKMLTGGKVLGNLNLYYAVVWYLIKENEIEYLKDIAKNAEEHLIFRLKTTKTMASLSGLAQFVTTQVPSDIAIWFCVNSGYFNQPADRDTFRFHVFNMDVLIDIVKVLNYPIAKGTEEHLRRTKALFFLLAKYKDMKTYQKKNFNFLMQCLYQKGVFINEKNIKDSKKFIDKQTVVQFVPIDGQATEDQIKQVIELLPKKVQNLPVNQLYYISTRLDAQLSPANIALDFNVKIPELPKFQINWGYKLNEYPPTKILISPKTLRPYYYTAQKITWEDSARKIFDMNPKNLLKGNKYYLQFVLKHQRVPVSADELILFWFNRYIVNGGKKTLPHQTAQFANEIISDYNVVWEKIGFHYNNVKSIVSSTMEIQKRVQIEKDQIKKE